MNNQNHSAENNSFSTRTIVNFPFLTTESLVELIDTLGFKMGLSELRYCQNCYRNQRLNNPTINELKIIDRVFSDNCARAESYLVGSFMTNSKLVADTYGDLMARRRAVCPDYSAPCSLPEMLSVLPKYLGRDSVGEITLFSGKRRNENAAALGYKKIAEIGSGAEGCAATLSLKSQNASSTVANGNIAYAILKSFNKAEGFEERLYSFLSSFEMMRRAKRTLIVDNKCVISALLALGKGIKLETLHFEKKDGAISPFEPLAEVDDGVIAIFDKPESVDMLLAAQLFGLYVVPLGYITPTGSIDGISQAGEHLSLSLPFLCSLAFSRAMGCEADGNECRGEEKECSVYINLNRNKYRLNLASCGGDSHFLAGFNTVLYAYSLCVASGAEKISASGVYTMPLGSIDEKSLGDAVELALGAYRAQCEFEICDPAPSVNSGDRAALTFHTLSEAQLGTPSKFVGSGTGIYYLEPLYNEDGLPSFDDLKKLHGYVRYLISHGAALSIHPTTDDMVGSLAKMSDTISPELCAPLPPSRYGGFIIESREKLQGLLIGRTPSRQEEQPAMEHSSIYSDQISPNT